MSINEKLPALRFNMRPIKGVLKVELFDAKTKELIQKVEKENLVTNAIRNMIQAYAATSQMGQVMPLATVGLGGIMLFDGELEADPDNILFPSDVHLVGYGMQDANTTNTLRGSKNVAESSVQIGAGGRSRMVWDFGTSQANGTIRSVALTKNANPFRPLSAENVASVCYYNGNERRQYNKEAVLAYEDGYVYVVHSLTSSYEQSGTSGNYTYIRTYTMQINKTYCPMHDYKVGDQPTKDLVTANEVHQTLTWTQTTYNTNPGLNDTSAPCVDFNGDGSAYLIWSPGNASGNGQLYVTKITRNGLHWTAANTEILTFTGAQFLNDYHKIVDGHFFVVSYDRHSIYKIDINNPQDIRQITLPEGWNVDSTHYYRTPSKTGALFFTAYTTRTVGTQSVKYIRNAILYPDYVTVIDGADGSYLYDHQSLPLADGYGLSDRHGNQYSSYLYGKFFSNYLGTIANLSTPIVKNASQTLKITYSLIDA